MNKLQTDQAQFERLKLKLAINKYLFKWGKDYAVQVHNKNPWASDELFNSVVEEMAAEKMLLKETGRNGGLILVYHRMEAA